jgi:predicted transcriptional regulator
MVMAARRANQRAMAAAKSDDERQAALRKIRRSEKAWRIEQKYQICLMELEGRSATQIATELGMSPGAVGNILSKAHRQRSEQTVEAINLHRAILLRRAEMIIRHYAPIALDDDLFARIARGEPVSEKSEICTVGPGAPER